MLIRFIVAVCMIFSRYACADEDFNHADRDGNLNLSALSHQTLHNSVVIYDGKKRLGKFNNLIRNEPSLSSSIVEILGGGLAIYVDSNGSRNKFHLLIPIYKINNKLYTQCAYKTVYDSVDETQSVGASCKEQGLDQFDLASVINGKNLVIYKPDHNWLASLSLPNCENPVGFVYGNYYVVRCVKGHENTSNAFSSAVFKKSGEMIFSVDGYEFIPAGNSNDFVLNSDSFEKTIFFQGSLGCFTSDSIRMLSSSTAKIGDNLNIQYSIRKADRCYQGFYSYSKNGAPINLIGQRAGNTYYLLEQGKDRTSTGLFILNNLDKTMNGIWVGTKSGGFLAVQ
jgi:hypothetical protein